VDDELSPVLGAPVEPRDDVWAAALSAALDDPREPGDLAALVPDVADTGVLGAPVDEAEVDHGDPDGPAELPHGGPEPGAGADDGLDTGAGGPGADPGEVSGVDNAGWAG
jgi:hypothetical protein